MSLDNLEASEKKITSQNGEDGVIAAIFDCIGTTNRHAVEFGCEEGVECNTAQLIVQGWTVLLMDLSSVSKNPLAEIKREFVTAENIQQLLEKYQVPTRFDLLSIDIDGNDFWVWQRITHRPRVVICEYNSHVPPNLCRTILYDPMFRWQGTDYFGASLLALKELGRRKGYTLVYCERSGANAFFVADEELPAGFVPRPIEEIYRRPNFYEKGMGFRKDYKRVMIDPFLLTETYFHGNNG